MRVSRYRDEELLFSKYQWNDVVRTNEEAIKKQAAKMSLVDFEEDVESLAVKLAKEYTPEAPTLRHDDISVERKEVEVERQRDGYRSDPFFEGGSSTVTKNAVEVTVPVEGDTGFFRVRPSKYNMNPPRAVIGKNDIKFLLILEAEDPAAVRTQIDSKLKSIEGFLNWQREDAEGLSQSMLTLANRELEYRRSQLGAADDLVNNLGYKVKKPGS